MEKKKYSFTSNIKFHYCNLLKWEPKMFFAGIFIIFPSLMESLMNALLPAIVVSGVEERWEYDKYVFWLIIIVFLMWVFGLCKAGLKEYCDKYNFAYRVRYMKLYAEKKMSLDYEILENKDLQDLANEAHVAVFQGRGIEEAVTVFTSFAINIFGLIIYAVLLTRINVCLVVVIAFTEIIVMMLLRNAKKNEDKIWPDISEEIRKMEYLTAKTGDSIAGKDIRLFHMKEWLATKYNDSLQRMERKAAKTQNGYLCANVCEQLLVFIKNSIAYILLIGIWSRGRITISEFIFYIAVINNCSQFFSGMIQNLNAFGLISQYFGYLRAFLEVNNNWKGGIKVDSVKTPVEIEFRNVTFAYGENTPPILKNFNLIIKSGEKVALLGLNGAGKTTIVKLLCGFYQPQSGVILINGVDRNKYSRDEFYKLISAVFQDSVLLPITLQENITNSCEDNVDERKLKQVLSDAGFFEKYESLEKKGNSLMVKEVNEKAVDFSGGEKQKILFARALYKDAPIVILDEPTAALDPIGESELYMKFQMAMEEKTVIFISHRMSTTAFCNRIIFLEDGQIVETGTHEQLMDRKGRYYELYQLQGQYYKKNPV